jgi:MFS family permease
MSTPEVVVQTEAPTASTGLRGLPRNVWAVSLTSFFMDMSSEMVIHTLPLFLSNVLGVQTSVIGLIEGIAETIASILKLFSGWLSDRLRARKWLAVAGYGLSALSKPFFLFAASWEAIAAVRWADRTGKGIRTAPRDALVADSVTPQQRGIAFGFHRAADTAGEMMALLIAIAVVWLVQAGAQELGAQTFQVIVIASLVPAALAVLSLAVGAQDVPVTRQRAAPKFAFRSLGKSFMTFMVIVGLFTLGNSSDAFLVLRAQNVGLSVVGILGMLATFSLVYTLISTPAGSLSDRIGRRRLIIGGWLVYAVIYFGFGLVQTGWQVWALYAVYGVYYGMAFGTSNALIADLVPPELRGTAYGTYNFVLGILAFPASFIAGVLWQSFGPASPFFFGAALALIAALLMWAWKPRLAPTQG